MECWNPNDTLTFRSPVARMRFRIAGIVALGMLLANCMQVSP